MLEALGQRRDAVMGYGPAERGRDASESTC